MNQYTHDVLQLLCVAGEPTIKNVTYGEKKGIQVVTTDGEVSDLITNILSYTKLLASEDVRHTKVAKIKLAQDPVVGQEYILNIGIADEMNQEDEFIRTLSHVAKTGDTAAIILQDFADQLAKIVDADGKPLIVGTVASNVLTLVEQKPHYRFGSWPETLAKITLSASEILVGGSYEFPFVVEDEGDATTLSMFKFRESANGVALPNSRKIADLELFAKAEKGNVNPLSGFPYNIDADFKIGAAGAEDANGYDTLTVHYAYVGPDAANQKSERDVIFVTKSGQYNTSLKRIEDAIAAL